MKRITDEALDIIFKGITNNDTRSYTDIVLDTQLQADKEATRNEREKIARIIKYFEDDSPDAGYGYEAEAMADQIIKILTEEGVTDGS